MEKEDKRMAWFPAPYLERLDEDSDQDEIDGISERGKFQRGLFPGKTTVAPPS